MFEWSERSLNHSLSDILVKIFRVKISWAYRLCALKIGSLSGLQARGRYVRRKFARFRGSSATRELYPILTPFKTLDRNWGINMSFLL